MMENIAAVGKKSGTDRDFHAEAIALSKSLKETVYKKLHITMAVSSIIPILSLGYLISCPFLQEDTFMTATPVILFFNIALIVLGLLYGRILVTHIVEEFTAINEKILHYEDQIVEAERLSTLSKTAVTLGHEINNPLQGIMGSLYFLERYVPKDDQRFDRNMSIIKENVNTIRDIVTRMSNLKKVMTSHYAGHTSMIDIGTEDR